MVAKCSKCDHCKELICCTRGVTSVITNVEEQGCNYEKVKSIHPHIRRVGLPACHRFIAVIKEDDNRKNSNYSVNDPRDGGFLYSYVEEEWGDDKQMKNCYDRVRVHLVDAQKTFGLRCRRCGRSGLCQQALRRFECTLNPGLLARKGFAYAVHAIL